MRIPHRGSVAFLAVTLGLSPLTLALTVSAASAEAGNGIRINEIITNSSSVDDSIELTNIGSEPVDVAGWVLRDAKDTSALVIGGEDTTIAPGGFLVIAVDPGGDVGFGLGDGDSARVFAPDGTTLVDSHEFASHSSPSWSRCPDGTGEFVQALSETLGAANHCGSVEDLVLNEVETKGDADGDWIEIANPTAVEIDASGLIIKDNKDVDALPVPADTKVPAGGHVAVFTEPADDPDGFGLGDNDNARLFTADGATLIDSYEWGPHAATSYGRCPDMTGDFQETTAPTRAAANDCPAPGGTDDLVINEVSSNPTDFVELKNVSDHLVDVSGLKFSDNGHDPITITTESTPLQPGELFSFETEALVGGFGLGKTDTVNIFLSDGATLVDSYAWSETHRAPSYGLCPDIEGMIQNAAASPGAPNVCQPVQINEIEGKDGDNPDWIELANVTEAAVDITGWVLKDSSDANSYVIPATTVPAGGYVVLEQTAFDFGLGNPDSVRLFKADGTSPADSYEWADHATTTYGRCADGVGSFVATRSATKGAANDCPPPFFGVETQPWPGSQDITLADPLNAFVSDVSSGDVSGLAFDPHEDGVLWAVKNKNRLFKLTRVEGLWTPVATDGWAAGKELLFANGAGEPDTEGVTVGPDGAIYATSERDNADKNVPLNTVLRYDPTQPGPLTATAEWNVDADFDELDGIAGGSNLGFEGLTWVPDSHLVDGGFIDQGTNAPYVPGDYPGHGDGLFFMALENDGRLYAYALGDGSQTRVAVVESGFAHVMDVSYDPERQRIWAACDDTCDGQVSVLKLGDDGHFAVETGYDRPTGMPNLNNEGFAIAPQSTCTDGFKQVVWADDGGTGGNSLRASTLPCTELPTEPVGLVNTAVPVVSGTVRVGSVLSATAGTWTGGPTSLAYQWLANGQPVAGARTRLLRVLPAHLGKRLSLRITASAAGLTPISATSAPSGVVQWGSLRFVQAPRITKRPRVGTRVMARIGVVTPGATRIEYLWRVNGRAVPGARHKGFTLRRSHVGDLVQVAIVYRRAGYLTVVKVTDAVRVRRR